MSTTTAPTADLEAARRRAAAQQRLRWELLVNIVRKDLKVKYKGSFLGFAWSLANPLLLTAVYYFVFSIVLKNGIPDFVVYLMSGLLVWTFFQSSVQFAVGSVVGSANLVKKVRFPRTVLPLSSVGFFGVHFVLQMAVFLALLVIAGFDFFGPQLLLAIPALIVITTFTIALSLLVSALNVRYRDVQHLLDVTMLAWFWINPVVYAAGLIREHAGALLYRVYFLDPPAIVAASFQRAIYRHTFVHLGSRNPLRGAGGQLASSQVLAAPGYRFYLEQLGLAFVLSAVLLVIGLAVFRRMSGDFAEEL